MSGNETDPSIWSSDEEKCLGTEDYAENVPPCVDSAIYPRASNLIPRWEKKQPIEASLTTKEGPKNGFAGSFRSVVRMIITLLALAGSLAVLAAFASKTTIRKDDPHADSKQMPSNVEEVTLTEMPTISPSRIPSNIQSEIESNIPAQSQSMIPSISIFPTDAPHTSPSSTPTSFPTAAASNSPTSTPTYSPTETPSGLPSSRPTFSISPTNGPSHSPTLSMSPSNSPTSSPTRNSVVFYAMGDVPYGREDESILIQQLEDIPIDASFIFHVGDTQRAYETNCEESAYKRNRNILLKAKVPVFITPGDNDFNDCPSPSKGLWNFRKHLAMLDSKWEHSLPVQYQKDRIENVAFLLEFVLIIGINMVGGSVHDKDEWEDRLDENLDWTMYHLKNKRGNYTSVVIFGHAGPTSMRYDYFESLADYSEKVKIPMMYIHGDGHEFEIQRRVAGSNYLNAVQVDQGSKAPPLKVTVKEGSRGAFSVSRSKTGFQ